MKLKLIFDTEIVELSRKELEAYLTNSDSTGDCTDEELIALLNKDEETLENFADDQASYSSLIRIELEPSK